MQKHCSSFRSWFKQGLDWEPKYFQDAKAKTKPCLELKH